MTFIYTEDKLELSAVAWLPNKSGDKETELAHGLTPAPTPAPAPSVPAPTAPGALVGSVVTVVEADTSGMPVAVGDKVGVETPAAELVVVFNEIGASKDCG